MVFPAVFKIDGIHLVHNLPEIDSVFHVLVGILEDGFHNGLPHGGFLGHVKILQGGEQGVVHKIQQFIPGHAFFVFLVGPAPPATIFRDDGMEIILIEFPVIFLGVVNLQEKDPHQLFNPLGIPVDSLVHPHYIPYLFHKSCIRNCHQLTLPSSYNSFSISWTAFS
jgi:hypothetical protein